MNHNTVISPEKNALFSYFKNLSKDVKAPYFTYDLENCAIEFLRQYDAGLIEPPADPLIHEILNRNFSDNEVLRAIESLKNNKCPGLDGIPSELFKAGKYKLVTILTIMYNYFLEFREFPRSWSEGLRIALFKSGDRLDPACQRGITIWPNVEKIFEICFNNRFDFINEAFDKIDQQNGGFLKGSRTSDNIFIVQGLIQRQLSLGQPLIICFVDFSKAFDLVNRNLLFYKLIQSGWGGRLIDTMRSLYRQTSFRLRHNGKISDSVSESIGVAQGGSASGNLFRKFLQDAKTYIKSRYGVVLNEFTLIAYLLWADDMVKFSNSVEGMQRLLDCLFEFCVKNHMVVNEVKTKCMVFGTKEIPTLTFNGVRIELVNSYKYLGNMISPIQRPLADIFSLNHDYLCNQARKAVFSMRLRTQNASPTSPKLQIKLFNALVKQILTYGSDVWGTCHNAIIKIDTFHRAFLKIVLGIKGSTSNVMVYGELGIYPIKLDLLANCFKYFHRLHQMNGKKLAKKVFNELSRLESISFPTWISKVENKAMEFDIDLYNDLNPGRFKHYVNQQLKIFFLVDWQIEMLDRPKLRCYKTFKHDFRSEKYLACITIAKHRIALARLRCSSHHLAIETGRWRKNPPPPSRRICLQCRVMDDEVHFVVDCRINRRERAILNNSLFRHLSSGFSEFRCNLFINLMCSDDEEVLKAFGQFVYASFKKRDKT